MSRGAYETLLRGLVARISNVRFVKGTVTGVKPSSEDSRKVESVSYRAGGDSETITTQTAQLIIGTPVFYCCCLMSTYDNFKQYRLQWRYPRRVDLVEARRFFAAT